MKQPVGPVIDIVNTLLFNKVVGVSQHYLFLIHVQFKPNVVC